MILFSTWNVKSVSVKETYFLIEILRGRPIFYNHSAQSCIFQVQISIWVVFTLPIMYTSQHSEQGRGAIS